MSGFDEHGWYTGALNYQSKRWRSPNFWPGNDGRLATVLHITDGVDSRSTLGTNISNVSAHFLLREEGIYQHVSIHDSAWANGIWEHGHRWRGVPDSVNPNRVTISIEREGRPNTPLSATIERYTTQILQALASVFATFRPYVPHDNLIGHYEISPFHRPDCPGPLVDFTRIANAANAALPDHGASTLTRWRVYAPTPVYIIPSLIAPLATIGDVPVQLIPNWVIGSDAQEKGWTHVAQPAPWGWLPPNTAVAVAADTPIGPPPVAVPIPPAVTQSFLAPLTEASTIFGPPTATADQVVRFILNRGSIYSPFDVRSIVGSMFAVAEPVNVDPVIVAAQSIHETSANIDDDPELEPLSSFWAQRPRRNPAGIGVTGARGAGVAFPTWHDAIEAQVGRLLRYFLKPGAGTIAQQTVMATALHWRDLDRAAWGSCTELKHLGAVHNPANAKLPRDTWRSGWAWDGAEYGARIAALANALRQVKL